MIAMQQARSAGSDPAFLLKALGESSGELKRTLQSLPFEIAVAEGTGRNDGWCALAVGVHMRSVERGIREQIETILMSPGSRIPAVDMDDIPLAETYRWEDPGAVGEEFRFERRRTIYLLWELMGREWDYHGEHPYRGPITISDIARELYQHDLEHLWQLQRIAGEPWA